MTIARTLPVTYYVDPRWDGSPLSRMNVWMLCARFGIAGERRLTLREIGRRITSTHRKAKHGPVSIERVRQNLVRSTVIVMVTVHNRIYGDAHLETCETCRNYITFNWVKSYPLV